LIPAWTVPDGKSSYVVRPDQDVRDDGDRPGDRDHVPGDERPLRVAPDQQIVDRDGREEGLVAAMDAEAVRDVRRTEHELDRLVRPDRPRTIDQKNCLPFTFSVCVCRPEPLPGRRRSSTRRQ
jgi:hypothetical protein